MTSAVCTDQNMSWAEKRWVAFDTETTGLDGSARIIEIACVLFENGEIVEDWSTLICPEDVDWNDENVKKALAVNQIDPSSLVGKPTFAQTLDRINFAFDASPVWVAHNAEFDLRMLNQEHRRYHQTDFPFSRPGEDMYCFCTKLLSRSLHPLERGHRLQETASRWGVVQDGAHRASSDAITCGRILDAMSKGRLPDDVMQVNELQKQAGSTGRRRY